MRDTADQLDACRAQSVLDEARIADLEADRAEIRAIADTLAAQVEGLGRQNAELEHDLARAESALADRLRHDAHTRPTGHTIDRDALAQVIDQARYTDSPWTTEHLADAIAALVQPADGILITHEEAALAVRAARHSAESIRSVEAIDPGRLHPDVAPYAQRLDDLADRLTR